jgi:hypothetical protein
VEVSDCSIVYVTIPEFTGDAEENQEGPQS